MGEKNGRIKSNPARVKEKKKKKKKNLAKSSGEERNTKTHC